MIKPSLYDPNSYANTHEIVITHAHLNWNINFNQKLITGSVELSFKAITHGVSLILLDTRYLSIKSISDTESTDVKFQYLENHSKFGTPLQIQLNHPLQSNEAIKLVIEYQTTDNCTALQWLDKNQTIGKQYPYLFSQCQAIHARSIIPCQDTPGIKFTYSAKVTVERPFVALMSAVQTNHTGDTFTFEQKTAIPSYLIAIAVGKLEGIKVGPRTTVWSEPEVVKSAAWEFEETELFIKAGEDLLTPYEWGIYDLLILPPSFPYGGMENPCLTFVTPSLIAGDRSLVDVVAHELAHSWMGNLVTNKNWEHFWLNEGFTVFIERKILGRIYGEPFRNFHAILGVKDLQDSVDDFGEAEAHYTCLCPKLANESPDDAYSSVPYEKGFNFLIYLETLLGGSVIFEKFIKAYVVEFSHKSITTDDFKMFLYQYFTNQKETLDKVQWNDWLHKPGMPIVTNLFDDSLVKSSQDLAKRWNEHSKSLDLFTKSEFDTFTSNQKVMFLETLSQYEALDTTVMDQLEKAYNLNDYKNCEIKFSWQMLCLKFNAQFIVPHVIDFVTSMGRMKYVRPLYKSLYRSKGGSDVAVKTFQSHRQFYHPICASLVAK
ncbi:peptidase family M1-domain-containing protein, partial [Globomyces pollinis-pini]